MKKPKIIVILGPTASGKSSLAVQIAKKFNGEIISADSRQVYKNLNIGTGKITKKEMKGIPHHLLDVISPKRIFTVSKFKKLALKEIKEIIKRDKIPIICGGTGFYIDSLVTNTIFPEVPPNKELRKKLNKKSLNELSEILKKLDKNKYLKTDLKNKVRLIRSIEIIHSLGCIPSIKKGRDDYNFLQIGIKTEDHKLKEKIKIRLLQRIKKGMISETKKLHQEGVSFKRMEELGLEYRYLAKYLKKEIDKNVLIEKLNTEIWKYAKRQKTWFKRNKKIKWFYLENKTKILKEIYEFIKN